VSDGDTVTLDLTDAKSARIVVGARAEASPA
jgi:hypothetical protein